MSFPDLNLNNVRSDLFSAIRTLGSDATFLLRDGTTSFTIKCTRRTRTGIETTNGLSNDRLEVQIPYDDWNFHSPGRPPQKGDRVTMHGHTSAIDDPRTVGAGDLVFGWICRTLG